MTWKERSRLLFWAQVEIGLPECCWVWTGRLNPKGYGEGGSTKAHRYAYADLVGPIPPGYWIDHLCRNRACVNPDHLEAVTPRENVLRGNTIAAKRAAQTHCVNGHEFSLENTYITATGGRQCKKCVRIAGSTEAVKARRRELYRLRKETQ